jgi:uncharacterized protein (UPF0548 family)
MRFIGIGLGNPGEAERRALVEHARASEVTYAEVGVTLDPAWSAERGARVTTRDLGVGPDAFAAAVAALRDLTPQRDIGSEAEPAGSVVAEGATIVFILRRGPIHLLIPNRIVAVIDEPKRFAYAYGTLPGHPESGEEGFTVELLDDGTVRATIRVLATAPSRAIELILGRPIALVSQRVARRYLRSLAKAATA